MGGIRLGVLFRSIAPEAGLGSEGTAGSRPAAAPLVYQAVVGRLASRKTTWNTGLGRLGGALAGPYHVRAHACRRGLPPHMAAPTFSGSSAAAGLQPLVLSLAAIQAWAPPATTKVREKPRLASSLATAAGGSHGEG